MLSSLRRDPWLSDVLGVKAFGLDGGRELTRQDLVEGDVDFAWVKTSAFEGPYRANLEALGFCVIEGSLTFEQSANPAAVPLSLVRKVRPEDEEAVALIAGRSFNYDRFHQDPLIAGEVAARLKSEWARNYFRGSRGDVMFVCERRGVIAGFLLAIKCEKSAVVIDLIGTAPEFRGQGVASALLMYLRGWTGGVVRASTQFSNLPSIRMYVRHGFLPTEAAWTMHFHREQPS